MPLDLADIVATMLAEVKKKPKKPATRKKTAEGKKAPTPTYNPWTDEALVLLATEVTCKRCGNCSLSWGDTLYIQRKNTRRKNTITEFTPLITTEYSCAYGALPKRIEMRSTTSSACPLCFGLADGQGNAVFTHKDPRQLPLPGLDTPTTNHQPLRKENHHVEINT